jgi:hypothetical protein
MYAGGSIFVIAVGAILYWAVHYHIQGISLPTVGLILMVVGAISLLFSLLSSATWRRRLR